MSVDHTRPYNGRMTATPAPPPAQPVSIAEVFIGHLAAGDFALLATLFEPDVSLTALLPDGLREWHGPAEVEAAFVGWFGRVEEYELVEAAVDHVGPRVQLQWRARVRGGPFGDVRTTSSSSRCTPTPGRRAGSPSCRCCAPGSRGSTRWGRGRSASAQDAELTAATHGVPAAGDLQLGEHRGDVVVDRLGGDEQPLRDLGVGGALGEQARGSRPGGR